MCHRRGVCLGLVIPPPVGLVPVHKAIITITHIIRQVHNVRVVGSRLLPVYDAEQVDSMSVAFLGFWNHFRSRFIKGRVWPEFDS